jgi:hypothetical protein
MRNDLMRNDLMRNAYLLIINDLIGCVISLSNSLVVLLVYRFHYSKNIIH